MILVINKFEETSNLSVKGFTAKNYSMMFLGELPQRKLGSHPRNMSTEIDFETPAPVH